MHFITAVMEHTDTERCFFLSQRLNDTLLCVTETPNIDTRQRHALLKKIFALIATGELYYRNHTYKRLGCMLQNWLQQEGRLNA